MHGSVSLFRMLEDLAVWAGLLAAILILVAWRIAGRDAHKRLRVAAFFLVVGASVAVGGTFGNLKMVRLIGVVAVGVALVRAVLVLAFDWLPLLRRTPKIVRDINAGFVYFLALMVVLASAGVKVESLLTTSALLTAVLGFALQDTLGNLVAGLAIQAQRPFSVGDWIQVDGSAAQPGKVIEVNWRATTVVTLDQIEVSYPNAVLAKTPLTNFSLPKAAARRSLFLHVGYPHAPDIVCEALLAATKGTAGVLEEPRPSVVVKSFDAYGVQYWVRFFIDDWALRDVLDDRVWTRIWYTLQREGLQIPYPTQTLFLHEISEATTDRDRQRLVSERVAALRAVDFLAPVGAEELQRLADRLRARRFTAGETILRQGEPGESFFLIRQGTVSVRIAGEDGSSTEVARLAPGQFFGEMSLMTGEPRTATVRAESRAELYEIDHSMFESVLLGHEEVARQMSAILADRRTRQDDRASSPGEAADAKEDRSQMLFARIKSFFHL